MKRTLLLSTLLILTLTFVSASAQDSGGMSGGEMMDDISGGMSGGAMMTDDAMFDDLISGGSMSGGDTSMMDTSSMTIAQVVAANPDFGILAQLLGAAGLTETLNGEGPFTVFAPNDDAFLPFTNNEIVSLLGDTEALTDILTYHVVSGELTSTDLVAMASVTTLQGSDLTIGEGMASDMSGGMMSGGMMDDMGLAESMSRMSGGSMSDTDMSGGAMGPSLMVNGATVVGADIITANGVIHVIDSVLMPSN